MVSAPGQARRAETGSDSEHGAALVMALALIILVGALTASMAGGSRILMTETVLDRAAMQASQAADGGIELARWALGRDPGYRGEELSVGQARVQVRVEPRDGGRAWTVRATAVVRPRGEHHHPTRCRVEAELAAATGLPERRSWRRLP